MNVNENSLTRSILIALFLGGIFGLTVHHLFLHSFLKTIVIDHIFDVGGQIFLASLKMLVIPLVFVSILKGVSSLGDIRKLGSLGVQSFALYITTTAIAISLALFVAHVTGPGLDFDLSTSKTFNPGAAPSFKEILINLFPANPFKSFFMGDMLQIIIFAILLGFGILTTKNESKFFLGFLDDLYQIVLNLINFFMSFAPYGVFMLIAKVFGENGLEALKPLMSYFFVVIGTLFLHCFLVYFTFVKWLAKRSPRIFFQGMKSAMLLAFSTASSTMTLPLTLKSVTENLKVNPSVASFSLSLGSTINMDGTAIMQGVATVFIAQAYNLSLGFVDYGMVVLMATLASIGTAGVPGVGLITLSMVLSQVGLPVEGIGLVIGVDRLLDMFRTAVNITGDAMVSCVVHQWNQDDEKVSMVLEKA